MTAQARLNSWWSGGACLSEDPELFFPLTGTGPSLAQATQAKEICAACKVRPQCLAYAMEQRHLHGIWGGTTEEERHALQDPQGAPARSAKPA